MDLRKKDEHWDFCFLSYLHFANYKWNTNMPTATNEILCKPSESPKQDFLVSAETEPSVTRNHRIFGRN